MRQLFTILSFFAIEFVFAQMPILKIVDGEPIQISKMNVDITVTGNIATTEFDIVFYNPNDRVLEGEIQMPLHEGQEISRYALDINGKLREGVVVEKVKARQVYEAVVRENIDPGILSKTKGNAFKTKVYPIPERGYKRLILALTEVLKIDNGFKYYSLPFNATQKITDFTFTAKVLTSYSKNTPKTNIQNTKFEKKEGCYFLSLEEHNFIPKEPIAFSIPVSQPNEYEVFTEERNNLTYFYINYTPQPFKQAKKKKSKNITLLWDKSFSGGKRSTKKELKLLKEYLENNKQKKVTVISFDYKQQEKKVFKISQNASQLIDYIQGLQNDGATCLENINLPNNTDEILFFSDGVNTIGEETFPNIKAPINTITSSVGANYDWLRGLARKRNGIFINLQNTSMQKALDRLALTHQILPKLTASPNISDLHQTEGEITGIMTSKNGEIIINQDNNQIPTNKIPLNIKNTIKITRSKHSAPVSRIWASLRIQDLSADYTKNKNEITELGKQFNISTRNTSFIVLDRAIDYARHHILPPKELRKSYDKLIAEESSKNKNIKEKIFTNNLKRIHKLKEWYENPPKVKKEKDNIPPPELIVYEETDASLENTDIDEERIANLNNTSDNSNLDDENEEIVVTGYGGVDKDTSTNPTESSKSTVKVLAWIPNAPYLKILEKSNNFDTIYFKYKSENKLRPSFYIEVANLLFQKGKKEKAVRILSNILELDLENPELLKTVAHKLLQEKELYLALQIFKEIKELRPEEPQSYRDLALTYEMTKQYQKALEMYMYILGKDWKQFENIKDIIFNELNHLVSLHKKELNLDTVPDEYLFAMPLDMRFTIDWTSNDNDIDLWVVEPSGEKCYYKHRFTQIGGKNSIDFTTGYGPEEYSLKNKKRGTFTIYANYFGDNRQSITGAVTVYTRLYTNYGKADESLKVLSIQLKEKKETIQLGLAHSD